VAHGKESRRMLAVCPRHDHSCVPEPSGITDVLIDQRLKNRTGQRMVFGPSHTIQFASRHPDLTEQTIAVTHVRDGRQPRIGALASTYLQALRRALMPL